MGLWAIYDHIFEHLMSAFGDLICCFSFLGLFAFLCGGCASPCASLWDNFVSIYGHFVCFYSFKQETNRTITSYRDSDLRPNYFGNYFGKR